MLFLDPKDISYSVHLWTYTILLHREKLSRIHESKYLGCFLSDDQRDDVEISNQIRTLYTRSNK